MKKYQQLLIVSLGLVSFICFLIYKHEYDRLRNVLEVLEVFGSPPPRSQLEVNQNRGGGLMPGSINELNLGQGGNQYEGNKHDQFDDTFIPKNGHGVGPPDDLIPGDDLKGNDGGGNQGTHNKNGNVIQNPVVNSGEVMDNGIDDAGDGHGMIGKIGASKVKKVVQRQESIFKERQKANIV
ncbi:unnamed protein product [Orchesella dallaii]|uniref:Uncharacterized protein n=1 Tax=Orchesella dallaii TaxID=48710 RepID=A0ABP1RR43_9HEXA